MTGIITFLGPGYGFAEGVGAEHEVAARSSWFIHRHDLVRKYEWRMLEVGSRIYFEATMPEPPKGPRARAIMLLKPQPTSAPAAAPEQSEQVPA